MQSVVLLIPTEASLLQSAVVFVLFKATPLQSNKDRC